MIEPVNIIEGPRSRAMRVAPETMGVVAAWCGGVYDVARAVLVVRSARGTVDAGPGSYVVSFHDGSFDVMDAATLAWYFDATRHPMAG